MTTRQLAALTAAAALVATGCGGNPEADPSPSATATRVAPTLTPTSTASPIPTPSATETAGVPTSAPTDGPAPTQPPPPPDEPNPNPEGVDPEHIPAGTYIYDTSGTTKTGGSEQALPSRTELIVSAPSNNQQTLRRDLRQDNGNGQQTTLTIGIDDGSFLLYRIHTTVKLALLPEQENTFVANPPGVLGDPESDAGWKTSFTMSGDGTTAEVSLHLVGFATVTVGGTDVRAAVVDQDVTFSGQIQGTSSSRSWYRPEDLLALREDSSTNVSSGGFQSTTSYQATLRSLSPS